MLEDRLRAFEGADQADLFGPASPGIFQRTWAAIRRWWMG